MHKPLFKSDIHRKALRAAAGVALFGGSFACGGERPRTQLLPPARNINSNQMPESDAGSTNSSIDSGFENNVPDSGFAPDTGLVPDTGLAPDTGFAPDAEQHAPDQGMLLDAGSIADASTSTVGDGGSAYCDQTVLSWEDYVKCCKMYNWDPARGCLAWGPPAPPELKQKNGEDL